MPDPVLIAIGVVASVFALFFFAQRLELAVLSVVIGVILNIDLPVSLAGQPLNTQRVAILALFAAVVIRTLGRGLAPRLGSSQLVFSLCMAALAAMSVGHALLTGYELTEDFQSIAFNLILFNLIVIALQSVPDDRIRQTMITHFPVALALVSVYFLLTYRSQISELGLSSPLEFRTGIRARADEARNLLNAWAATLVLFIPLAVRPLLERNVGFWRRGFSALAVVALLSAVLTTYSRGPLFALAVSVAFGSLAFMMDRRHTGAFARRGRAWAIWTSIFTALTLLAITIYQVENALLSFMFDAWRLRFEGSSDIDASFSSRLQAFDQAMMAWSEAPWFGHGSIQAANTSVPLENTFLAILVQFGLIGLLIYIGALWTIIRKVLRRWRKGNRETRFMAPAWIVMYLVFLWTNELYAISAGAIMIGILLSNNRGRILGDRPRGERSGPQWRGEIAASID